MFTHGLLLEESKQCVLSAIHLVLLEGNGIFVDIWQYVCYFFFLSLLCSILFIPAGGASFPFLLTSISGSGLGHVRSRVLCFASLL